MSPKNRSRTKPKPDCQACGACCVCAYDQEGFCDLIDSDLDRFSAAFIRRYVLFSSPFQLLIAAVGGRREPPAVLSTRYLTSRAGPFRGISVCTCALLSGSLLHRVRCRCYPFRPRVCRTAVSPGTRQCLAIRRSLESTLDLIHDP